MDSEVIHIWEFITLLVYGFWSNVYMKICYTLYTGSEVIHIHVYEKFVTLYG